MVLRSRTSGICRSGRTLGTSRIARWLSPRTVGREISPHLRGAVSCVRTSCSWAFERCELLSTLATKSGVALRIICLPTTPITRQAPDRNDLVPLGSTHRVISHNSKLQIARKDATPECADCNLRLGLGHMRLSGCSYQSELLREIRISLLGICRRPNDRFRSYPAFMGAC